MLSVEPGGVLSKIALPAGNRYGAFSMSPFGVVLQARRGESLEGTRRVELEAAAAEDRGAAVSDPAEGREAAARRRVEVSSVSAVAAVPLAFPE